jgi:hypothetical protein
MNSYDLTCPHCGYNLTGLVKPICPECGGEFDPVYLRGMARKYPGHMVLGIWTIKYLPPLLFIALALWQWASAGRFDFRSIVYALGWVSTVWLVELFTP